MANMRYAPDDVADAYAILDRDMRATDGAVDALMAAGKIRSGDPTWDRWFRLRGRVLARLRDEPSWWRRAEQIDAARHLQEEVRAYDRSIEPLGGHVEPGPDIPAPGGLSGLAKDWKVLAIAALAVFFLFSKKRD
jgi:hypothetical protein